MAKKKKNPRKNPSAMFSFDIETNQYYNYSTWGTKQQKPEDVPKGVWSSIEEAISKRKPALRAVNYIAGSSYSDEVFKEVYNQLAHRIMVDSSLDYTTRQHAVDLIKMCLNDILKVGAYKVVAERSEMYMGTMVAMPYDFDGTPFYSLTLEDYTNYVKKAPAKVVFNLDEADNMFRDLEKRARAMNAPVLVLIHNLSYEVMNCLSQLPVWKEWVQAGLLTFLSNNTKNSYKSVDIMEYVPVEGAKKQPAPVIMFRDTWKLTNKSISKLGKIHNYPKLDYEYNVIRNSSQLTQKDFDYNRRDCEIALLGYYDAYKQAGDILWNGRKVPISANNIVSTIAKSKFSKEFKQHKFRVEADGDSHMTALEYAGYKPVTGGGLVGVIPEYAFNIIEEGSKYYTNFCTIYVEGIGHVDLNSAHPSQSTKRLFPVSKPRHLDDPKGLHVVQEAIDRGIARVHKMYTFDGICQGLDVFDNLFPDLKKTKSKKHGYALSGYGTFVINNLRLKKFNTGAGNFTVPSLWGCKINTKLSGADTYNLADCSKLKGNNILYIGSKLKSADKVTVELTFEDFAIIIGLFYDYDSYELVDCSLYEMNFISPYLYKQFEHFANKKTVYKAAVKAIKANDSQKLDEVLSSPYFEKQDADALRAEYLAKGIGAESFAEQLLLNTKGQFNGIYGTSYQSLFRDASVLKYDPASNSVDWSAAEGTDGTKYDETNSSGIDVLQGSYIAQWSRVDLALNMRLLISMGATPLYFATDSVYYFTTPKTDSRLTSLIKGKFSPTGDLPFNGQTSLMKKYRPSEAGLGGMDFENDIKKIGYTQSLKIIAVEKNVDYETGEVKDIRKLTFSGCSADTFFKDCQTDEEYYERLFMEDGFVSAFEENSKTIKASNVTGDNGFVLDSVGFVNNRTTSSQYQDIKASAVALIKV